MHVQRSHERISVEIPIVVTTVLDSLDGKIIDLSQGGAQVVGCSLPAGTSCQLDLDGHITFGTVRWSEEDRMASAFPIRWPTGRCWNSWIARARRCARPCPSSRAPMPAAGSADAWAKAPLKQVFLLFPFL